MIHEFICGIYTSTYDVIIRKKVCGNYNSQMKIYICNPSQRTALSTNNHFSVHQMIHRQLQISFHIAVRGTWYHTNLVVECLL
jgi:hypothetical protein